MTDTTKFDLKSTRAELAALRTRARELEQQTNQALREKLSTITSAIVGAKEMQALVDDIRDFLDTGQ